MAKTLNEVLTELGELDQPISGDTIYKMADLNADEYKQLQASWGGIPVERRRALMQRLTETSETNFDMDFGEVIRLALTDLDDQLRAIAIEAAWDDDTPDMATRLIAMASGDIAEDVRAAAVSALGRFILLGELGKYDRDLARRAENIALKLYNDKNEKLQVRRRALESIANCGREGVEGMIDEAYEHRDPQMRASAVFAMGRSCDAKYASIVLRELTSDDPEMRYEATRAAGELELRQAVPYLADILLENDREIMEMAVWSLGEIGGDEARRLLEDVMERADERGDDALAEAVEEALDAASLAGKDLVL